MSLEVHALASGSSGNAVLVKANGRGLLIDVGRHFMPVSFLKKYIDLLALHKMNTFHWHLTEDQGWRLEIRKYPKLTSVGAWRSETIVGRPAATRFVTRRMVGGRTSFTQERRT